MKAKLSNERLLAVIIALPAAYVYLSQLISYFAPLSYIRLVLYPIAYFLGIIGYVRCLKYKQCFSFFCIAVLIIIFNFIAYPSFTNYFIDTSTSAGFLLSDFVILSLISLPALFLATRSSDFEALLAAFSQCGMVIMPLFIMTFVIMAFIINTTFDYMNISYGVVPWLMLCWGYARKEKKKIFTCVCVASFALVCISGCRGAAVTCMLFIVLQFISTLKYPITVKQLLIIVGIILAVIIVAINLQGIVSALYALLTQFGFKSRTLELYLGIGYEKGLGHYSDRSNIQVPLLNSINAFGHGLYGDRLLTGTGQYAHNVFLEWIIDFGVIIGGGLCIWFIILILKNVIHLIKNSVGDEFTIICAAVAILCCKYMVSASYLHMPEFWMFIGLLIATAKSSRSRPEVN